MMKRQMGMFGTVHAIVHKADGEITQDLKFKNEVLNIGIKNLFSKATTTSTPTEYRYLNFAYLYLGSGTTPPTIYDPGLENRNVNIPSEFYASFTRDYEFDTVNHFYWNDITFTFTYGEGVAEGSHTELSLGDVDGNYFTRALFRDESGNPTTLVVGADEFLTVFYTVRYQDGMGPPQEGVATIGDQTVGFSVRPYSAAQSGYGWDGSSTRDGFWNRGWPFRSFGHAKSISGTATYPDEVIAEFDPATDIISLTGTFYPGPGDREIHRIYPQYQFNTSSEYASYEITFDPPFIKRADYRTDIVIQVELELLNAPIENLALVERTALTLEFSWDDYPDATVYHARLRQEGTIIQTQEITAPNRTVTFSGLDPATFYVVDVYADTTGRSTGRNILMASTID